MKKTLKNIIICICIIYFILSLSSLLITKELIHEAWLSIMDLQNEDEVTTIREGYDKMESLININLTILGTSTLIGTMLGLLISIKESSIKRYIVYFIVGFVVYSLIWTGVNYLVNLGAENGKYVKFIGLYQEILKPVIISYIMLYVAVVSGIIIYNKNKVKELNETLNNKDNKIEKEGKLQNRIKLKTVIKIVIVMVVLGICIFVAIITRKTTILIKYCEKIAEINNSNNYYMKDEWGTGGATERYYKDGIIVIKEENEIKYGNGKTKEWLTYNLADKTVTDGSEYLTDEVWNSIITIRNDITGNNRYVGKLMILLRSFEMKIYTEEVDGRECYVFDYKRSNRKLYIDKETFLELKSVSYDSLRKEESVLNYTYEIGTVTDEDVAKPVFD